MSERSEAAKIGAKLQKNSGRGRIQKGDMVINTAVGPVVIDSKEYSKSFAISRDAWSKVCSDAMKVSKDAYPMLYLVLGEGNQKTRLAVIEYSLFEHLVKDTNDTT